VGKNIVYFDLETQRTFSDVGGDNLAAMKMSVGVTYSTASESYVIYPENRVHEMIDELVAADLVVGFNVAKFDYGVLIGYDPMDLNYRTNTLDMCSAVHEILGHRLGLDAIAQATLGIGKTGGGLDAIRWWREGRLREIAEYCCFDVKVTRLVHEYGATEGKVYYINKLGQRTAIESPWPSLSE